MIGDMLPLLAFAAVVVIARNLFEAYLLERAERPHERVNRHAKPLISGAATETDPARSVLPDVSRIR